MTALHAFAAFFMPHLLLAPIALPLLTAALMLLLREDQQRLKIAFNLFSTLLGLGVAVLLLVWVCTWRPTGRRLSASCWHWTASRP